VLRKLYSNNKLVVALFFIFSLTYSLSTSNLAHASSDYDAVFSPTSTTHVSGVSGSHTCSSQDISTSWGKILQTESYWSHSVGQSYATTKTAFQAALANGDGWAVQEREFLAPGGIGNYGWNSGDKATQITFTADDSNYVDFKTVGGRKFAIMYADSAPVYTVIIGQYWDSTSNSCSVGVAVSRAQYANATDQQYVSEEMYVGHDNTDDYSNWDFRQLLVNSPVNYPKSPTDYAGAYPATLDSSDEDGDLLVRGYEVAQGTSDDNTDTDGDGIDDMKESGWYPSRNDTFCGSECTYPNPTEKDLYVEVDWMKDPSTNKSYKPNTAQLTSVISAYSAHGIHAHIDTGQYGGGNELPSYVSDLTFGHITGADFYDYKNGGDSIDSNFNSINRSKIWHYLVSGYQYHADNPTENTSSGGTITGDDDTFIATGYIEDHQTGFGYSDYDTAISGTIIHELGHSMCLSSSEKYDFQSASCIHGGIDDKNNSHSLYNSSMNYSKQMFMVDYSAGANLPGDDHDDWNAVLNHMGDFANPDRNAGDSIAPGTSEVKHVAGISLEEAQQQKKEGTLGLNTVNDPQQKTTKSTSLSSLTTKTPNSSPDEAAKRQGTQANNINLLAGMIATGLTILAGCIFVIRNHIQ
jgi:hypothetical protein